MSEQVAHDATFIREHGEYSLVCWCGWTSKTTVRKQAIARAERHNGRRFEAEEITPGAVEHAKPTVERREATSRTIVLPPLPKTLHGHALERANICGDCGGPLRDARGGYRSRTEPEGGGMRPICAKCAGAEVK